MDIPVWVQKYKAVTTTFMNYGWFVPPFMMQTEFDAAERLAQWLNANPPHNDQDRKDHEEKIYRMLVEPAYNTNYRARGIWYAAQLDHLKKFNHLYESAIFSYYKHEYAQTVVSLLTALEGVLLSYYGYDIAAGGRKPSFKDLITKIKTSHVSHPANALVDSRYSIFRDTLATFLEKWLYKETQNSDFSLSVLNRHYVLHGMEAGNFYRPQDAHRLILTFDLLVEFLCISQGIFHLFIPSVGEDAFVDVRRDYYTKLGEGAITIEESRKTERILLKQHPSYVAPAHDPNIQESQTANLVFFANILNGALKARGIDLEKLLEQGLLKEKNDET